MQHHIDHGERYCRRLGRAVKVNELLVTIEKRPIYDVDALFSTVAAIHSDPSIATGPQPLHRMAVDPLRASVFS